MKTPRCLHCSRPLRARDNAKTCSSACRRAHWRRRARIARVLAQRRRCAACRKSIGLTMRADSRFCSARCRQKDYRRRKATAGKSPQKAHQRIIRERLAAKSPESAAVDIRGAQVRPITLAEARALIEVYEPMSAVSRFAFGIFFDRRCGGAVVYGDEYTENLGVWDRYGYRGKIIALLCGCSFVAVDVDTGEAHNNVDGFDTLAQLGPLPETLCVRTPSGGMHLYLKTDQPIRSRVLGPGLELRAANQYVIAPPSPGYMVINDVPLARLPDRLFDGPSRPVKVENKQPGGPLVATAQLPKPLYLKVLRLVPLSAVVTRHHQASSDRHSQYCPAASGSSQ
jgi:hypothetical protein